MYLRELINKKNVILSAQGLAVFFFLAPSREEIGVILLIASLLVAAIIGRGESIKARFAYAGSALTLAFLWSLLLGNDGLASYILIFAGVFLSGLSIFMYAPNLQVTFLLVFFLPWMAHMFIGALQIAGHLLTFEAKDIQHLLVTAKLSLSIGVKYYSSILSFVIASSLVFFGETKNVMWKYCLALALLLLALMDNRVALLSVVLSILVYQLKFRTGIEAAGVKNHAFRMMIGVAAILMFFVYYPRALLGYEGAVAAMNFQEYQSWRNEDLFYKEFCENDEHQCAVDQSVFFRLSWFFWGLRVVYDNPMGIGPGAGLLDRAMALYGLRTDEFEMRDFHSELMNIAVAAGVPGVLCSFALFGLVFAAIKKKMGGGGSVGIAWAYMLWVLMALRFVIESVGGVGMYLFSLLLFAFIAAEVTRESEPD